MTDLWGKLHHNWRASPTPASTNSCVCPGRRASGVTEEITWARAAVPEAPSALAAKANKTSQARRVGSMQRVQAEGGQTFGRNQAAGLNASKYGLADNSGRSIVGGKIQVGFMYTRLHVLMRAMIRQPDGWRQSKTQKANQRRSPKVVVIEPAGLGSLCEVLKAHVFLAPSEVHDAGRAAAVLGDNQLRLVRAILRVVGFRPM